ncbi:type IV toxin-antitoxin system AbiEi family antitoxin domain-containing protein [Nocardia cyriacigeorgica]|uniref:type IV toxin-antitoxin system AbiEi family antitoxin domain-containing protein n=1 Tax=Nocardia cyriacigeorgica TaxID=135487 RepID=UPI001895238E|nr:type IV toxin-antitoxin system AbiEi family antitoxin domain-containing protein [Nocardia cyriacigeorgica]MBF6289888.1 type IV toxin-antitoxin system AbiEi family antitoxin domain-containing protein [Nocardia cyriacigeorgica]
MRSEERLLELADLAGVQWGLFTSAQAGELGFSAQQLKRLADSELAVRMRQGVYRLTGAPESPADPVRAEWLALEPKRLAGDRLTDEVPVGVVSHRSAARLQDLGDIDADVHEFTVARRRSTRNHDVKFRIRELSREDWHLVEGLPITRPRRTVIDLAADGIDGGHLATIVRDAILTGDVTRDELAKALRPYAHRYGMRIGDGSALVHDFIGQAGIPESSKALTRDVDFPDRVMTRARQWGASSEEARALGLLQNLAVNYPGIDAALARNNERLTQSFVPQLEFQLPALENLLSAIKFPTSDLIPPDLHTLTESARESLSSKVFANLFSEAAQKHMAEAMRHPDFWTDPSRAPAEKTGDSEGGEDDDGQGTDRRRAPESNQ